MRMVRTCVSTVFSVTHRRRAMPAFVRPSAISASTSCSRGESSSSALTWRGTPTSVATTCGSSAVPPSQTRRAASRKSSTSSTRSLSR